MIFLFQQPESSHHGDCPICCLPIPLVGKSKFATTECCSKMIYEGCIFTDKYCQWEMKGQLRNFPFECLFCGHSLPKARQEGGLQNWRKELQPQQNPTVNYLDQMRWAAVQLSCHLFTHLKVSVGTSRACALCSTSSHHWRQKLCALKNVNKRGCGGSGSYRRQYNAVFWSLALWGRSSEWTSLSRKCIATKQGRKQGDNRERGWIRQGERSREQISTGEDNEIVTRKMHSCLVLQQLDNTGSGRDLEQQGKSNE